MKHLWKDLKNKRLSPRKIAKIEPAATQDLLIDQICLELQEIGACFWRMFGCWKFLDYDKHEALKKKFFDYFLTNAERSLLGKTRNLVASWRSEPFPTPFPLCDHPHTLSSHREDRKVQELLDILRGTRSKAGSQRLAKWAKLSASAKFQAMVKSGFIDKHCKVRHKPSPRTLGKLTKELEKHRQRNRTIIDLIEHWPWAK